MISSLANIMPINVVGTVSGTVASGVPTSIFSPAAIQNVVIVTENPLQVELVTDRHFLGFSVAGNLATTNLAATPIFIPFDGTIIKAAATVTTAGTGADIHLQIFNISTASDVLTSGILQIAAGETVGTTVAINNPELLEEQLLRLEIDQVGSGAAGANLQVVLYVDATISGTGS